MDELARVKPDTMRFGELMLNIRNGKIRIPDFQREFVWELDQIINLLDSVYRHYPIGSFLLWQTDDDIQAYRRVGEVELRQDKEKSVQYVLDGQQRLTSLFASLEQASITHRVNGKKVTKSIQVYFDLDTSTFVASPYGKKDMKVAAKRMTFRSVPGTEDYAQFLADLLRMIKRDNPPASQVVDWILSKPGMAITRARSIHGQARDMGLFNESDDGCRVTECGDAILEDPSPVRILSLLLNTIELFEHVLPKVLEIEKVKSTSLAKLLTKQLDEKIHSYKLVSRLHWLAGLGLGEFDGSNFTLSSNGRSVIETVYREIEIRERDRKEQEKEKGKRYFSVLQVTDFEKLVESAVSLDPQRREDLLTVRRRFESYPFSIIQVLEQPIETACEIFERINNSGKILNVVDLMVAKSWSQTFNLRERLNEFRDELKKERYDEIPDITIIQCLAAIVKRGVRRKDILNVERSAVEKYWETTLENVRRAIDFLKANVKITYSKILPYNALIVPLAFYFSVIDKKTHDNAKRKQLERWFWKASVSNRYDQAAETKLAEDIFDMENLAAGKEALFDYVAPALSVERIAAQKLNMGSAFCKTILCVLAQREPREFKDSAPVSLTSFSKFNSAELHHIFPKAYLRKHDPDNYPEHDSIANIALVKASANKEYSSYPPSKYLAKCKNDILDKVLGSHFINDPDKSGVLKDDFETFVQYRAGQVLRELRRLTGEMTEIEAGMIDSEMAVLERFELRLRDLIDTRLRASDPDYWEKTSLPDLRDRIEVRISAWLNETPGRNRSDVRAVDFCQMFDYFKIIKAHWGLFEPVFLSRSDLEQFLKLVGDFRNALAHNREADVATRQLALGALEWFDKAFAAARTL